MKIDLFERLNKNICNFEETLGTRPDVVFVTRRFFESLMFAKPNPFFKYGASEQKVLGLDLHIVHDMDLGGLDFQCFKSDHLNALGDRYKKDPRYSDYTLEIRVPRFASWEVSYVSDGSPAATINDADVFKNVKVVAPSEVLSRWVSL